MAYSLMTPHLLPEGRSIMQDIPQATVLEARSAIFLPIQKVTARTLAAFKKNHPGGRVISTADGALTIKIDSPLTQTHKNFLELLTSSLRPYYSSPDSLSPTYVFTRYWGTGELGIPDKYTQLDDLISYLQKTLITITIKLPSGEKLEYTEGLITRSGKISKPEILSTELGIPVVGTKELRYVRLSESYMRAFAADDTLRYPGLVRNIVGLSHPILQALVRHALSHRTLNHALLDSKLANGLVKPGLLTKIGIPSGSTQYEAQTLISERAEELQSWGLEVKPDARKRLCVYLSDRIANAYYCGVVEPVDPAEAALRWEGKPIPLYAQGKELWAYSTGAANALRSDVLAAGGTEEEASAAAGARLRAIQAFARNKAGVREEDEEI